MVRVVITLHEGEQEPTGSLEMQLMEDGEIRFVSTAIVDGQVNGRLITHHNPGDVMQFLLGAISILSDIE